MRRVALAFAAVLVAALSSAGGLEFKPAPAGSTSTAPSSGFYMTATSAIQWGSDAYLYRWGANAIVQRNGANAQSFYVCNTYTDASNYECGGIRFNSNNLELFTVNAGTGSTRSILLAPASNNVFTRNIISSTNDTYGSGLASNLWTNVYVARGIQGSKSKALTDNVATAFATMAMPQTAGSNYGGGRGIYTIFCKDATNVATEWGMFDFACLNLAGTESCTINAAGTGAATVNVIKGDGTASFVAPVFTAAAGADLVTFSVQSDCTGVTPTTHTIEVRFDMPHPNTLAFP